MRNSGFIGFTTLILAYFITVQMGMCQDLNILHYTETSGYDHNTRNVSFDMFSDLGNEYGFSVVDDQTGEAFNTLANLENYAVVVFFQYLWR